MAMAAAAARRVDRLVAVGRQLAKTLARPGVRRWAPAVLLLLMAAVVWSRVEPWRFIWQLGVVAGLAILALFCGGLLGCFHATPAEVGIDPPAVADHGHGHTH